ncbi:MAG: hypothetical protein HC847_16530 [Hydrococcus sp. RU_2_2]|nr:hypothetical protein [Hydrococcus sp. RU_2_2]
MFGNWAGFNLRSLRPPAILENINIPDFCNYQGVRQGVIIAPEVRKRTHKELLQKKLLNLFVGIDEVEKITSSNALSSTNKRSSNLLNPLLPVVSETNWVARQSMSTLKIERILQELIAKPIGIQGVALVSDEGQPIFPPMGMDKNSTLIMAGSMLYLAKSTQDEFNWSSIETISVRAQEGYIILANCNRNNFLLVKAGKALSGLLEGEINRTVEKLQIELQTLQETSIPERAESLPQLAAEVLPRIDEVLYELDAEILQNNDDEIRYRGRRTNK